MAFDIKKVEYYNITVGDHAAEGSRLLTLMAGAGVDLLAFKAVPAEPGRTRFTLFPIDVSTLTNGAKKGGLKLDGPYTALIVQGDEKPGACAGIYAKLARAGINVIESYGIAHIKGNYGVIVYLKREDCEKAAAALKM